MARQRPKLRRAISADQVASIFDEVCIRRVAQIAKLPAQADIGRFGESIREAARIYARDAESPTVNDLHDAIAALHRAAERRLYKKVSVLLADLYPAARDLLSKRAAKLQRRNLARVSQRRARPSPRIMLPTPETLSDLQARDAACANVVSLCALGGGFVEGRKRPSGNRSRTWRTGLYAPARRSHVPKRSEERTFVIWLQVAWLESTGTAPAKTAHHEDVGPFARMARECLRLVGAPHADAVEIINQLNRSRGPAKDRSATD